MDVVIPRMSVYETLESGITPYIHTCTGRLVNKLQTGKKNLLGHVFRSANDEIDFFYLLLALGAGNITKAGFSFTSKIPSGEGTYDLVFCLPIFVIQLPISYGS